MIDVDVAEMDAAGVVAALLDTEHDIAVAEARKLALVAQFLDVYCWCDELDLPGREKLVPVGCGRPAEVAEFAALELGAALGLSRRACGALLHDVHNLRSWLPLTWRAALAGQVRAWEARRLGSLVARAGVADPTDVERIDARLAAQVPGLPPGRSISLVNGLLAGLDADEHHCARVAALDRRRVALARPNGSGVREIVICASGPDAMFFDAMTDRIADILGEQGDVEAKQIRRSKAVGVLATPARALALLQAAAQPGLGEEAVDTCEPAWSRDPLAPGDDDAATRLAGRHDLAEARTLSWMSPAERADLAAAGVVPRPTRQGGPPRGPEPFAPVPAEPPDDAWDEPPPPPDAASESWWWASGTSDPAGTPPSPAPTDARRTQHHGVPAHTPADAPTDAGRAPQGCAGHVCGQITVPVEKLLPLAVLYVHVSASDVAAGSGAVRVEGGDAYSLSELPRLLDGLQVTIKPVVELNTIPPADGYEVGPRLREGLRLRDPYEAFPFSTRPTRSRHMQPDHTQPYQHGPDKPAGQTRADNLALLSTRVHRAKTHGGWGLEQPQPGVLLWTSPLGYRYRVDRGITTALGKA